MPLNERNCRTFHRKLYAGQLQTVTVHKRNDDMQASVVTAHKLFDCRWSSIAKSGQPIAGDQTSDHFRELHIPTIELHRVGILHINPLDRFIDKQGRTWQPESQQVITVKLFETHHCVQCRRCDDNPVPGV